MCVCVDCVPVDSAPEQLVDICTRRFESAVRPNGRNAHCVMGSSGRWNVVVGSGDGRGRVLCRATLAWLSLFLVDSQRLDNSSAALSLLLFKRCFQMTTEYARICFFISVIAGYHTVKLRCQKLTLMK